MTQPERRSRAAASDADAAARRRRRAVLRAHHPDVGGDPDELIRQLALLDSVAPARTEPVTFVRRRRGLRRLVHLLRRARRRRAARRRTARRRVR